MIGLPNADESDLITLADIDLEEKQQDVDSSIISLERELYLESRRQASTVVEQQHRLHLGDARLNNYIIDEEDSDNGIFD